MLNERYQRLKKVLQHRRNDLTVLVDHVEKAHNLAAIARSADAVACTHLHAVTHHSALTLRSRAAMGTGKGIDVIRHPDLPSAYAALREQGFQIVAAHFSPRALDYREPSYLPPTAFVMGQEKFGLRPEHAAAADLEVTIPMFGLAGSLNVSVAAALLLYEALRQRQAAGLTRQGTLSDEEIRSTLFQWCHPDIAEVLDRQGLPYPDLDENGDFSSPLPR